MVGIWRLGKTNLPSDVETGATGIQALTFSGLCLIKGTMKPPDMEGVTTTGILSGVNVSIIASK